MEEADTEKMSSESKQSVPNCNAILMLLYLIEYAWSLSVGAVTFHLYVTSKFISPERGNDSLPVICIFRIKLLILKKIGVAEKNITSQTPSWFPL